MPPEHHQSDKPILEESLRIKDALLEIQENVNAYHSELQRGQLLTVRSSLGYPESDDIGTDDLTDVNITSKTAVISPEAVDTVLPLTQVAAETTLKARKAAGEILKGLDLRLIAIIGPCSMHDPEAALEYAQYVGDMRAKYGNDLLILMRNYPEKPRTEKGWKGFIHDPLLDGSDDMNLGLIADRMLALRIAGMGVPQARERLGVNTPQYVDGLIAYDSIGARNVEDQNARMYGSGTSSVIGFKNSTNGSVEAAISACVSANSEHTFIGLHPNGQQAVVATKGNPLAHVILRGGKDSPNFDRASIVQTVSAIQKKNEQTGLYIPEGVIIDASHGNKVDGSQFNAVEDIASQVSVGSLAIRGIMIESNINGGNQKLNPDDLASLEYGVSITDACAGIEDTSLMLEMLAQASRRRRNL